LLVNFKGISVFAAGELMKGMLGQKLFKLRFIIHDMLATAQK
jgi:hypothetical protein